jgi:hypothetical protein
LSFATNSYAVGNEPYSVVAADLKGDGRLALICANEADNTLTVLTNDGSGDFGSNVTYKVGNSPKSVIAADVNGDGRVDVVCANFGDNTLTVFTNDGTGGLVLACVTNTILSGYADNEPNQLVAADLNGDGKVDIITANGQNSSGSLSMLTNNGSGGFNLANTLPLPGPAQSVTAANLNLDGHLDLICPNLNAGRLYICTNNGSGAYKISAILTVGSTPNSVVAADLNGDHKMDLVCLNNGGATTSGSLTVFTNNGSGGFGLNATYNAGNKPTSVTAADLTGKGSPDLICAIYGGTSLMIYTNNGNGTFGLAASPTVGNKPYAVIAADVNNDGKFDLICPNRLDGTVSVLVNTNAFPSPTTMPSMTLTPSNGSLLASWPSTSAGWSLQFKQNLTGPGWSPGGYDGYSVADDGTNKSLYFTPISDDVFFRLIHP